MELRRRRRDRRVRLIAVALAALVALTVLVTVRLAGSSPPPPVAVEQQQRTQRTLLLQVRAPNGDAAVTALLAHDPAAPAGAVVLIPPQTLVTVPGSGSYTVGRALRTVAPEGSRSAVADALGVTVDGGWVVDQPSLARLVNALGGLTLDIDVPVMRQGRLALQPGSQRLNGASSLLFLTYRAPDEQEQTRLARVQEVLDALFEALPDPAELATILGNLEQAASSSVPLEELADLLTGIEADDDASALQYDTLPVVPIDTGSGAGQTGAVFRVDPEATRAVVDRLLAGSVPAGSRESGNRVLVLNGVGTPGLGEQVRARLVPQGFVFVGSRNASRFGYAQTQVLVPEETTEAQELGARVARALGLTEDVVRSTDQLGSVADAVVLVGADFRP